MDKPTLSPEDAQTLKKLVGKKSPLQGEHWCHCTRKSKARRVSEGAYLVIGIPGLPSLPPPIHRAADSSLKNFCEGTHRMYLTARKTVQCLDEDVARLCGSFSAPDDDLLPVPGWSTLLFSTHEAFEFASVPEYQHFHCEHVRLLSDPLGTAAEDLSISLWRFRARLHYPWFALAIKDDVILHAWTEFKNANSFLADIAKTLRH